MQQDPLDSPPPVPPSEPAMESPNPVAAVPGAPPLVFPPWMSEVASEGGGAGVALTASQRPTGLEGAEPATAPMGARLLRGALWGVCYGQWWTAWFLFHHAKHNLRLDEVGMMLSMLVPVALLTVLCMAAAGVVAGTVIGAANPSPGIATIMAMAVGLVVWFLEWRFFHGAPWNIPFWLVTSRFVGAGVWGKLQRLRVPPR